MSVKKFAFLVLPILRFLAENKLRVFENRSRRDRADRIDPLQKKTFFEKPSIIRDKVGCDVVLKSNVF